MILQKELAWLSIVSYLVMLQSLGVAQRDW